MSAMPAFQLSNNYIKYGKLSNFLPDPTIIVPKKYLSCIKSLHYEDEIIDLPPTDEWYPLVNSYYPFTENVDAFARVSHLIEEKQSHHSTSSKSTGEDGSKFDSYSESAAHQQYLRTKPLNFLVIGKPGVGQENLGRIFAAERKCVYVDPEVLLEQEINSDSRVGQCIEFNLRCGRSIGIDVIIRLLVKKIQTRSIRHRGFVLCGFPLIPNDLYEEDPISSESAIFNVREIFDEIIDGALEVVDFSTKVQVSLMSEVESSSYSSKQAVSASAADSIVHLNNSLIMSVNNEFVGPQDISTDLEKQLNVILGLFHEHFMVIYISCGNADVVSKRDNCYFDIYTKQIIDMQKVNLFFSTGDTSEYLIRDLFDFGNNPFSENPTLKHLVKLPENFPANVRSQLSRYHKEITNSLDARILMLDHQYCIKLDGRNFISEMVDRVKQRLRVLPVQSILLPQKLSVTSFEVPGEGPQETVDDDFSHQETFEKFSRHQVVSPLFKYSWSEWGVFCPVSMAQGRYIKGSTNHVVHFLNKIFFLADEDAVQKFYENPRTYLLPPFPRPGPRIFLFGPPLSGKTVVAKCLSYLLNYKIFSTSKLNEEFVNERIRQYIEKVKQSSLTEAMKLLEEEQQKEYERRKLERETKIKEWENDCITLLEKAEIFITELQKLMESNSFEFSSFPMKLEVLQSEDVQVRQQLSEELNTIKAELVKLNLPVIDDLDACEHLRDTLYAHLPDELAEEIKPNTDPVSVLDEFVLKYVEDRLRQCNTEIIELKAKTDFPTQFVNILMQIEASNDLSGWIFDGMATDVEQVRQIFDDITPTEIIILSDTPDYTFLMDTFRSHRYPSHFREFREFFMNMKETEVAFRCPSRVSTQSFKAELARDILDEMLSKDVFEEDPEEVQTEALTSYRESLTAYDGKMKEIREFFSEMDMDVIDVSVTDLPIPMLLQNTINKLRDRYRQQASEFTDSDRAEEVQAFLSKTIGGGEGGEGDTQAFGEDDFAKNRRYGDTSCYCPVTLFKDFVLWRGKDEFTAKFEDKIYLMSTEKDYVNFIKEPRDYLKRSGPITTFPPPRICVIGVQASGKTTIAKLLSNNLGVRYINYQKFLKDQITGFSTTAMNITSYDEDDLHDALEEQNLDKFLNKVWFTEPLKSLGFVMDNFPRNESDLKIMIEHKAIPDVIICMTVNHEEKMKKALTIALDNWKEQVEVESKEVETYNKQIVEDWQEQRRVKYNEIIEMKREQRYSTKIGQKVPEAEESEINDFTSETQISMDSVVDEKERAEAVQLLDEEFPDPVLHQLSEQYINETEEEVVERLTAILEETDLVDIENMQAIRTLCNTELIDWYEIQGDIELERTKAQAYKITDPIKFRSQSLFERCYEVSVETAEKLLEQGYYFLSRFGRCCPVKYWTEENTIQMFQIAVRKRRMFPIIHRQYIYFVVGKDGRDAFMKNPLKYVCMKHFNFQLIPYRVSVIGPPKSGKTTLARRMSEDLGFNYVSRGDAVRYVLQNLPFSLLRRDVEDVLRKGGELSNDLMRLCVQAITHCGEATTSGAVFDGFPNSIAEIDDLKKIGLLPHVIFDLQVCENSCYKFAAMPNPQKYPQYSRRFIKHLYDQWNLKSDEFRKWCDREYQNIYKLPTNKSIWGIWVEARDVTFSVLYERKHYHKYAYSDWPLRLANMLVTPFEFLERISNYKTYCPVCIHHTRSLTNGGDPPDRTGLVHFREYFYWICQDHIEEFLLTPEAFIPPENICLPQELPCIVELAEPPDEPTEEGYCLVCYLRNIPKRIINRGKFEYAASFFNKLYLFDSRSCRDLFMADPGTYAGVVIHYKVPPIATNLSYDELPILGMLEQYVAHQLVKAVHHVGVNRPIIPGLSIVASALVCVGLHLKVNNPKTSKEFVPLYRNALETFHDRRKNLVKYLNMMKTYLNPHLGYEEPDLLGDDANSMTSSTRRVPVPDARFDYLCEYYKPASKVPGFLNVVDIAGLVKGASEGQGLGNAFLSHISACDAIFHLLRAFDDDDVTHVEGEINPVRDLEIIAEELRLKDEETLTKSLEKLEKTVGRGSDKKLKPEYDTLCKVKTSLVDEKQHIRFGDWDVKDIEVLNKYLFLTSKPTIYLVNLSEKDYIRKKNKWLIKIKEWVDKNDPGALIIPFSGVFEHKLVSEYEDPELRKKFMEEAGATSALDKIIVHGYKALQLEYFFTAGADEVKAWTVQKGTKAPQAGGRIHTDFERGFIMAEVMKFQDFKEEGTEAACKSAGKYRQQGRNYVVEDGDIIYFKVNDGAGLKDAKKK